MIHFDTDECVIKAQGSFATIVTEVGFFLYELNEEFNKDTRYKQDEFFIELLNLLKHTEVDNAGT